MKRETQEQKLNRMLGLEIKAAEVKIKSTGKVVGVTEPEIQEFRQVQGLIYFLQAPELFTHRKCKHCGDSFYVSRKYIAFCSYTCIRKDLEKIGIKWSKGRDIEGLALDPQVYNGNEPIWITSRVLSKLLEMVSQPPNKNDETDLTKHSNVETLTPQKTPHNTKSLLAESSNQDTTTEFTPATSIVSSTSSISGTTPSGRKVGSPSSQNKGKSRRIISSS